MMNSAAFRLKTARAPAGSPRRGKPSSDKGLMQGSVLRDRRGYEISRYNIFLSAALAQYGRPLEDVDLMSKKGEFLL